MLQGKNAENLEDTINEILRRTTYLEGADQKIKSLLLEVDERLSGSVRAVETIRFNPFKGTGGGGNQSFATALISENGDGVVLSSLYSRDRVSIFSKPIKQFQAEFELSGEEKEVLERAKQKVS